MTRKSSYANVAATVALVLALAGGTAIAAGKLVTKPGQLARGVVTNGKVREGSLAADRLTDAAREELAGAQGPAGPPGPAGEDGDAGGGAPSASAYSEQFFGPDLGPSYATMQDLTELGDQRSGQIVLDAPALVMVTGAVSIQNTEDGNTFTFCKLQIEDAAGGFEDVGEDAQQEVGGDNGDAASLALVGTAERQAGSYDVRIQCRTSGPSYRYRHGSLAVWTAAP